MSTPRCISPLVHGSQTIVKINDILTIWNQWTKFTQKFEGNFDNHGQMQKGLIVQHIRVHDTGMHATLDMTFKGRFYQGIIHTRDLTFEGTLVVRLY